MPPTGELPTLPSYLSLRVKPQASGGKSRIWERAYEAISLASGSAPTAALNLEPSRQPLPEQLGRVSESFESTRKEQRSQARELYSEALQGKAEAEDDAAHWQSTCEELRGEVSSTHSKIDKIVVLTHLKVHSLRQQLHEERRQHDAAVARLRRVHEIELDEVRRMAVRGAVGTTLQPSASARDSEPYFPHSSSACTASPDSFLQYLDHFQKRTEEIVANAQHSRAHM